MRWFGEPWPSREDRAAACQSDANHIETPVGRRCLYCYEKIVEGDRGEETPYAYLRNGESVQDVGYVHVECLIRQTVGGPAHLAGVCRCSGGVEDCDLNMSPRESARLVWRLWTELKIQIPMLTVTTVMYVCGWISLLGVRVLR